MAERLTFVCTHCKFTIKAWDDGNPYFLSDAGKPQFFYHPCGKYLLQEYIQQSFGKDLKGTELDAFLENRTGNMSNMICLDCGREFKIDLKRRKAVCNSRKCKSKNISHTWELNGKQCPTCKLGVFKEDETQQVIS